MTPEPSSRDRIVSALADVWGAVAELGAGLTDAEWDLPTRCPGWTVRDQVSHMIGTESMLAGRAQPTVEVGEPDHVRNDIGRLNEAWIAERRDRPGGEVLDEFRRITADRLATLERMDQAQFDEEAWTPAGHATYGRFMQIRVFDCWMHELDIRAAVGRAGHVDGVAADVALDEIATALGFAVGKRAGAPSGSTVALVVSGSPRRRFDIEVTDRARVVTSQVLAPTATVTTDLTTFAALVGGRIDPEGPIVDGRVALAGDPALADRVARNLAFVI